MCKYKITNVATGPRWLIGPLEVELKSFCDFNNLEIKIEKSGFMFQTIGFVIRGESKTEQEGRDVLKKLERLVEKYK